MGAGRLGRHGRLVLAFLLTERHRPVGRDELAEVLWGDQLPRSWEASVRVVVSKVRAALRAAGLAADSALVSTAGCYRLRLPEGAVVDVEAAARALEQAEGALRGHRPEEARPAAELAMSVAARQFVPEVEGHWAEQRRADLRQLHLRAIEVLSEAYAAAGEGQRAAAVAEEAVTLEPLRESAHRRLMAAHEAAGDRAQALRAYERCRVLLAEELGVDPSPRTQEAYTRLLGQEPPARAEPAVRPPSPGARPPLAPALTSFVGRGRELAELDGLLSTTRLLTLTGTGGVGKTRLALELAARPGPGPAPAVPAVLVELGRVSDPDLVPTQALAALGGEEQAGATATEALVDLVGAGPLLVVLDGCEHLVAAAALLVETLLRRCPGLAVVATSREPLRVPGETVWRVPSLSLAGNGQPEAVRLFVERARAADARAPLAGAALGVVAQICRRLDGIPLAIELAAARVGALSVHDVAARLDDCFELLTRGPRTAPARQQTLRAAVDWSYRDLPGPERRLFEALAIFAGTFRLSAADRLCPPDPAEPSTLDRVSALVDKSFVVAEVRPGPGGGTATAYRLLETMRQYGRDMAARRGELDRWRRRHFTWAAELAETAAVEMQGPAQGEWLQVLDEAHDDLRAALEWGLGRPGAADPEAVRLASDLSGYWQVRGHLREGRRWLEQALQAGQGAGSPAPLRARVLISAGNLAMRQGDYEPARLHYQEALVIFRALGDETGAAAALHGLGNVANHQADLDSAASLYAECLAIGRRAADRSVVAASLINLGSVAHNRSDYPRARALFVEALEIRRLQGDGHGVAMVTGNLGYVAFQQGDHAAAHTLLEQSVDLQRRLGDRLGLVGTLANLGSLALAEKRPAEARRLLEESLGLAAEVGDKNGMTVALLRLAKVARADGDLDEAATLAGRVIPLARSMGARRAVAEWLEGLAASAAARAAAAPPEGDAPDPGFVRAATLLGAAGAVRDRIGAPVPALERAARDATAASARAALGEAAWSRSTGQGRAMGLDEVIDYASTDSATAAAGT